MAPGIAPVEHVGKGVWRCQRGGCGKSGGTDQAHDVAVDVVIFFIFISNTSRLVRIEISIGGIVAVETDHVAGVKRDVSAFSACDGFRRNAVLDVSYGTRSLIVEFYRSRIDALYGERCGQRVEALCSCSRDCHQEHCQCE